jgi:hypothetical protein
LPRCARRSKMARGIRHRSIGSATAAIVLVGALGVGVGAGPAFAGPRPKVGPHQAFVGLVNASRGEGGPVRIYVACHDPAQQTGPATPGQTVEISPIVPSSALNSGNTGDSATSIVAFFGAPPPTPTSASTNTVTFRRYDLIRKIPKQVQFPCSGTGQVTFVPLPKAPPSSRAAVVPVEYFAQP